MNKEKQELLRWINEHAAKFAEEKYTAEDVANLAIACGFSRQHVAEWQIKNLFKEAI